uniref:Peptide chain release factor domain-containing protein n=2 Tax=Meloidogyne TaxID=189290 RepID=A0A915PDA8_9BILA
MTSRHSLLHSFLINLFKTSKSIHNCSTRFASTSKFLIDVYSLNKCQMEFNSGAGGVEAALFTNELIDRIKSSTTGVRSAIVSIEGECCYAKLRFEPELVIQPGDLRKETMRSSGAGGANVNANSTAVRLTHIPTGISVKAQDERYLQVNEKVHFLC